MTQWSYAAESPELVSSLPAAEPGHPDESFARLIKGLRQRFGGKQLWLASVAGCTDAAVSLWESGKRAPQAPAFGRIVDALAQVGAPPSELVILCQSWAEARLARPPGYRCSTAATSQQAPPGEPLGSGRGPLAGSRVAVVAAPTGSFP